MLNNENTVRRITNELHAITTAIEDLTALKSRWNGDVSLIDVRSAELTGNQVFNAKKEWRCSITIVDEIAFHDLRWRSMIHEVLHSVSVGSTERDYVNFRGWEEGVVEWLQRHYRPAVLNRVGVSVPENIFIDVEAFWIYTPAIDALKRIAAQIPSVTEPVFFETMLQTPLRDRLAFTFDWGKREANDLTQFMRVFAEASGTLRR